jgi:hypothetical protein
MSLSLKEGALNKYTYNGIFIETGTFMGGGVTRALEAGFKQIHSIEVSPDFYDYCMTCFADKENVYIHLGSSTEVLPKLLENINEPVTLFLDGHFFSASPSTINNIRLAKEDVPLLIELDVIANHPIKNHTILIDDRRVFGKSNIPGEVVDWSEVSEDTIEKKLLQINKNYKFSYLDSSNGQNDILVAEVEK